MDHSIGPPTTSARVGGVGPQCYVLNGTATMLHQQQYTAAVPLLLPQSINSSTTSPPYNIHSNHRKLTHGNTSDNKFINGYNQTYSVVQQTPQVVSVITQRNHNSSIPHTINNNYYQSKVSNTVQLSNNANTGNTSSNLYYFESNGATSSQPQPIDHHAHNSNREGAQMRLKQNTTQVSASPQSYYNERLPITNRNNISTMSSSFYDLQRWPQSQTQTHQYNNNTTQVQNTYNNPNSYYSGSVNLYNNNVQVQNQQNVVAPMQQQLTSLEPSSRVVVPDIELELSHLVSIPVNNNLSNNVTSPSLPIVKCSKPSFMDSYLKFLNGNEETRENNVPPPAKKLLLPLAQHSAKPLSASTKKTTSPNNHNLIKNNTKCNTSNSLTLDDDPRYFPLAKSTCRFSSSDSDDDCWSKKSTTTTSMNTTVNNVRNLKSTSKNISSKNMKINKITPILESKTIKTQNRTSSQPKRRQSSQRLAKSKTVTTVKTAIRNNVDATEESEDSDIDPAWTP
ncbi:putative uncharacterized protein DDB_G0282133 [Daktulosphaira vitifoliae]|uniref:putative uncharacterized protein DDB_G0282133 n=1 Tax=Daktulosphaira vitifoliae TaxID=58002 RepID=UPI0021A9EA15|nr:putative uncharacterized protein DDB_G0282133 [Daktulosphaira vitifoliae]XP_050531228.1 putative uncharacterized protein DDB_G0282133 [Daktulosphaira vitifoliae]